MNKKPDDAGPSGQSRFEQELSTDLKDTTPDRPRGLLLHTRILIGLAGFAIAALALVPFLGYLEALALPALAARARRREPERYAGLRTLARD